MKRSLMIIWNLMLLATNSAFATELKVTVNNIDVSRGGQILVLVFGREGFPIDHNQAMFSQTQDSLQSMMVFTFDVDMDELAVKVLHDENRDGKLTKNWTGIYPKEGLGFSNDQKISLTGPPKYKPAKLSKEQYRHGIEILVSYP